MSSCPIVVENIKVRSLSVDYLDVSWEVRATTVDVLDYTFQVLRSEGAAGPWDALTPEVADIYLFRDNAIKSQHRYRQNYYQIRVRSKVSGEFWDFGPGSHEQDEDLISREVRSHISLLTREFIGERSWVLPLRTFGTRCSCYNPTLRAKTRSGCRTCFDTSFVRGYMHPIETWISMDPSPSVEQFSDVGKLQQNNTTARMAYFPPLKPGDLIVSGASVQRWKVIQVNATKHVGTPVHQELQLHEVPQNAIEYAIELELGSPLRDLFLKPERNFSNPQHLGAVTSSAPDSIFSLYNVRPPGGPR